MAKTNNLDNQVIINYNLWYNLLAKEKNMHFLKQLLLAALGMILVAAGVNLIIGVGWGMATFDTAAMTVQKLLNLELYGDAAFILNMVFALILIIFKKKLLVNWSDLITAFIAVFLLTRTINLLVFITQFTYSSTFTTLIGFFISVIIVNLGIYFMSVSNLVATPYDRFVIQLSEATHKELGKARLNSDIVLFIIAFALIFFLKLDVPVSIATIYIVVASGPIITLTGKIFKIQPMA